MNPKQLKDDTIGAIATPPGEGGIGIVRLSGPRALTVAAAMFVSSTGRDVLDPASGRVFYGHACDADNNILDEVLLHVMRAPHSYTCEDVVEINCHGGAAPLNAVLEEALRRGIRLAGPGEFTYRAFINGRIDLVQAEAVIDRIQARTRAGLRAAAAAAEGSLSKAIHGLNAILAEALAHIEAAVDFPDEDLPDLVTEDLRQRLVNARAKMEELLSTADAGRLYREGASIAIAGKPNVGKSSLFNALLRDARAIVSTVPGTTRDRIEEVITLEGIPVRLVDTAGLRTADDEVERIGVEIARDAVQQAGLVLFVVDGSAGADDADDALAEELRTQEAPVWLALNKADLAHEAKAPAWVPQFAGLTHVSAMTGEGLEALEAGLAGLLLGGTHIAPDQGLVTRMHQRDSLRRSSQALGRVLDRFDASPEFLSIDLRDALNALGEITGETTPDDLLETIFSSFCVGK